MAGTRVAELAKEVGMTTAELIQNLTDLGVPVAGAAAYVDAEVAQVIREMFGESAASGLKTVEVPPSATVKELADAIGVPAGDLQKKLMSMGTLVAINQRLKPETMKQLAEAYGVTLKMKLEERPTTPPPKRHGPKTGPQPRPPVVTVMGHVDHGKTTLLDYIRKSNVVAGEYGGITQHIGAYQVEVPHDKEVRRITFIDTPGHAAFSAMRARGASVTDIVVLVVAVDDGIMPQTREAIDHARAADVPIIVAINKMDLPGANPERIKTQLTEVGLVPTDYGGDTECVPISALKGTGVPDLLEHILFRADLMDLKADPNAPTVGTIIEARQEAGRGVVATVLVQEGTLRVGDCVVCGIAHGRIRAMISDRGEQVKKAGPATPVEIMGLSCVPHAGDRLEVVSDERCARQLAQEREEKQRNANIMQQERRNLQDLLRDLSAGQQVELRLIVKADVQGSVEAVVGALNNIAANQDQVSVRIVRAAVGTITESDVDLAAATGAIIVGFNVRADHPAQAAAERQHVDIQTYQIIYELTDAIERALKGLLAPQYEEVILGRAEVRATFRTPRGAIIAGCYVTEGKVVRNAEARVLRNRKVLFTGRIDSLRHLKDDVREMVQGYECGIMMDGFNDFAIGDVIEAYEKRRVEPV